MWRAGPVRARLAAKAADWPRSSASVHLGGPADGLTDAAPLRQRVPRFADLLKGPEQEAAFGRLRRAEVIGRVLGSAEFVKSLEARLGRQLLPERRRPKPKNIGN